MITTLLSSGSVAAIAPAMVENEVNAVAFSKIANPFTGILAGIIGAVCYNKFKGTKLPDVLAFFSGKRSVAIVTGLVSHCGFRHSAVRMAPGLRRSGRRGQRHQGHGRCRAWACTPS